MNSLKGYRGKYHITQKQLAEHLEMTESNYAMRENGKREWKLKDVKKVVEFFKQYEESATVEKIFF